MLLARPAVIAEAKKGVKTVEFRLIGSLRETAYRFTRGDFARVVRSR